MELAILEHSAIGFLLRWIHILAGVTWIGLLYYFNFCQVPYFKEADGGAKSDAIQKLVPRVLWWFRWGAMFTFLSGALLLWFYGLAGYGIWVGAVLGTLMFLNVWLIIWPKQKIVIENAKQTAQGGEGVPGAADALAKAGLASRTNTLFSIPMLFLMASSRHLPAINGAIGDAGLISLVLVFGIIAALEINGIVGKQGPMASVKGVITGGFVLTLVLYLLMELV